MPTAGPPRPPQSRRALDADRAQQIVDELVQRKERIDLLVNSAGIVIDGLMGAMTAQQWRDVLETNLFGTYNYCRAVAQQMLYQRGGAIVNLSSTAAEFASRGQVNYAASKGGIDGLTRGMAKEFAPPEGPRQCRRAGHDRDRYEQGGARAGGRSHQGVHPP